MQNKLEIHTDRWVTYSMIALLAFMLTPLNTIATVFFGIAAIRFRILYRSPNKYGLNPLALAFFLLFGMYFLSIAWSLNQNEAWNDIGGKLNLFFVPLSFILIGKLESKSIRKLSFVFSYAVILQALYCFVYQIVKAGFQINVEMLTYENLSSPLDIQPIYFALYMGFSVLLLAVNLYLGHLKSAIYNKLMLAFGFVFLVMLSSRMELVAFLFASGIIIMLEAKRRKLMKKAIVLILFGTLGMASLIALSPTNRARFSEMFDFKSDYTSNKWGGRSIRIYKWYFTSLAAAESPIIGVGNGDSENRLMHQYYLHRFYLGIDNKFNSHNQFLQTLLAVGLIGFLILVSIFRKLFRLASINSDLVLLAFALFLSVSFITESMLERQWGNSFFVILGCLLCSQYPSKLKPTFEV